MFFLRKNAFRRPTGTISLRHLPLSASLEFSSSRSVTESRAHECFHLRFPPESLSSGNTRVGARLMVTDQHHTTPTHDSERRIHLRFLFLKERKIRNRKCHSLSVGREVCRVVHFNHHRTHYSFLFSNFMLKIENKRKKWVEVVKV